MDRIAGLLKGRTIVFKLVAAAALVNVIGLAASIHAVRTIGENSIHSLAREEWEMQTRQIARSSAGGIRWDKPEVIDSILAAYREDEGSPMSRAAAYDSAGRIVAEYSREGIQAGPIDRVAARLVATAPGGVVSEVIQKSYVMVAPAGRRSDGMPMDMWRSPGT